MKASSNVILEGQMNLDDEESPDAVLSYAKDSSRGLPRNVGAKVKNERLSSASFALSSSPSTHEENHQSYRHHPYY